MKKILVFLITNIYILAHPHVFVVASSKYLTSGNKINGGNITWEWDEMWSQDILNECDLNNDGKFDRKETDQVYKDWFNPLRANDYFTKLTFNNKEYKIKNIKSFKVYLSEYDTVIFDFSCVIDDIVISSPVKAEIIFEDPTMYISFDEYFSLENVPKFNFKNKKTKETSKYGINTGFEIIYGGLK